MIETDAKVMAAESSRRRKVNLRDMRSVADALEKKRAFFDL
jgi:hypothetical protein